jgi:Na+(H+)/acetate symporter ActP
MKRMLLVLAIVFAASIFVYGGLALFGRAFMRADSYPTFMAEYQAKTPRSLAEAKRNFSDFVAKAFPVGSDESDAIAQITSGGFRIMKSSFGKGRASLDATFRLL